MIIHFTTVHPRDDSRMRDKELAALQRGLGQPVALYVQDGLGPEVDRRGGFPIVDTGAVPGRLRRMTVGAWRMFNAVRRARPKVAHFHDPELLPWGMLLSLFGIKVVYDIHEDVPQQVLHNHHLPQWTRRPVSFLVALVEKLSTLFLAGFAPATPVIGERFPSRKTVLVRNFPILAEMQLPNARPLAERPPHFAYIGTINRNRNIFRMIDAIAGVQDSSARLRLAGQFMVASDKQEAEALPGWQRVIYDSWLNREEVAEALSTVRAGLVVLKPVPHEMVTLPIKLFEYMAAGLPVIASDFPLWRQIISEAECGLLIDPEDTNAIASAMQWILDHPEEAQRMGDAGRRTVERLYSWEAESRQLVSFYRDRLAIAPAAA